MHKILYIGHYREGTGYSEASINYIRALNQTGYDVVCRSVKLNDNNDRLPKDILDLEQKDTSGSNICVQHVLPHYLDYNGNFDLNIALSVVDLFEMGSGTSGWKTRIRCMDALWSTNMIMGRSLAGDIPYFDIPHAVDPNKYFQSNKQLDLTGTEGNYKFYFIGEFRQRKNFHDLLYAFHSEFQNHEPVSLVIKTNGEESRQGVRYLASTIKNGLRMYPSERDYLGELVIGDRLSDEDILALHRTCDCFVNCSYGEGWSMPTFDAAAMGNAVLSVDDANGPKSYLPEQCLIDSYPVPALGMNQPIMDLNNGFSSASKVNICPLMSYMRSMYETRPSMSDFNVYDYSYEAVGNKMKESICSLLSQQ